MEWKKFGRIFSPAGEHWWMQTHAAVPFAEVEGQGTVRVYFSTRDESQRSRLASFRFDVDDPGRIRDLSPSPLLDLGALGAFDDHGVVGSWLVQDQDRRILYFSGVSLGVTVPFYYFSSAAVAPAADRPYRRLSASPMLERNQVDPFLTGQMCVLREGAVWRMWYVSGSGWESAQPRARHFYEIRYAESDDGLTWRRSGQVCIGLQGAEHAIARPCVLRDGGRYLMWYCYRGEQYRIGYAESEDGLVWRRLDAEVGIAPSSSGFDSEMLAYPFVFDHRGRRFMLYNGNGYGKSGIGLAVLD